MFYLILDIILIGIGSYWLTNICRFDDQAASLLGYILIAYAQIILAAEILSEFYLLTSSGFLITHAIFALAAWFIWRRAQKPKSRFPSLPKWSQIIPAIREHKALTLLAMAVLLAYTIEAWLVVYVPVNGYDSMGYHLPRVGHWFQNSSLRHFPTNRITLPSLFQLILPINAEVGILWTVLFTHSDYLAGFVSWASALGIIVAIYAIATRLGYLSSQAAFAALLFGTLPVVVLQSTTVKNDIVVAFFIIASLYFLILGMQQHKYSALTLSGIAIGLAIGTKTFALFALPGLGIAAPILAFKHNRERWLSQLMFWGLAGLVGTALWGTYNYILNWLDFGYLLSPERLKDFHTITHPNPKTWWANVGRLSYQFLNFGCLPDFIAWPLLEFKAKLATPLFSWLRMPIYDEQVMGQRVFTLWRQGNFDMGGAGFGPLGFVVFLAVIWHSLSFPFKRVKKIGHWIIAMVSLSLFAGICWKLKFDWHIERYFTTMMAGGLPLLASFYPSEKGKPRYIVWIILLLAIPILAYSTLNNRDKSLISSDAIWKKDYIELRCNNCKYLEPIIRYVEENIPDGSTVGLINVRKEGPFFGRYFQRRIVSILPNEKIDDKILLRHKLDYLIVTGKVPKSKLLLRQEKIIPGWYIISNKP